MSGQAVRKVVIAGGGTAGWCAAAALSKLLGPLLDITLVESEEIGIVGVGEATIPTCRTFHHLLGIDEREFLRATNGTFKLAIAFEDWARKGDRYIHSFGEMGKSSWMAPFHHLWLQARAEGVAGPIGEYGFEYQAAEAGKFQTGENARINYAYHFDAGLYGRFLRGISEKAGVKRVEGRIETVAQDPESGFITELVLQSGERIAGDLFIDCTGFHGLLIEKTLKTGYEDWSRWLPTNRAVAVQTESHGALTPYTRAAAHDAGWRWRIPLQNRVGNGLVYCSDYLSDDAARDRLLSLVDAPALIEPRLIRYQTGRRLKSWNRNCVTLGLSSGFIEPLESTSIHLFQIGVTRLIQLFPLAGITDALVDHYNALSRNELEKVRDFVILHYALNEREEPFWRDRRGMTLPDTLIERIALFTESGIAYQAPDDLFRVDSWVQVMLGQRLEPKRWHPVGQMMGRDQMAAALGNLKGGIARAVAGMPTHEDFIRQYCAV
ncbi:MULTISPECIES: tryptophan halogenase family protein [Asticcacaulis]|uniref:tryptophan halogenase family protein n=1 Tax=Asticcacaulis TaxID=76890 RepID=UPI001AE9A8C5|nr:tryptophan halogenase family protein [Asticcacaulis sp. BE141]MBP2157949.1 tryptophan halogenase [Asticcacaulis solisilvae]MDR6798994.1 tryptophan halogenase [Asticcacaulis sp. BE141]